MSWKKTYEAVKGAPAFVRRLVLVEKPRKARPEKTTALDDARFVRAELKRSRKARVRRQYVGAP